MAVGGSIQYLVGTPGDDTFRAPIGSSHIDGGGGIDTFYSGSGVSPSHPPEVSISGTEVTVYAAVSTSVLTGFEVYVFPDRTGNKIVNNNDGDRLVDDLFYLYHEHGAGADPDAAYHTAGWHQGLDPNAFFDTSTYLSLYPDVKAAGVDPLVHFDQFGWREGRAASIALDGPAYLAANPDVAAAHVDPLLHFLVNGIGEGRQAIPYEHLFGARDPDFDYVYYLQHNPDMGGAVDPYQHYETFGWREWRNPNEWFDSGGYLTHYPDVAAAGLNPLEHYEQFGWKEGRDPSTGFDTKAYLAAYPDVAAAHIDPLMHFLHFGLAEGRSPHGDGVWA